jgi:hypothetical protein
MQQLQKKQLLTHDTVEQPFWIIMAIWIATNKLQF